MTGTPAASDSNIVRYPETKLTEYERYVSAEIFWLPKNRTGSFAC